MNTTTFYLNLSFMSADGKTTTVKVPDCKEGVVKSDVLTAAENILTSAALDCGENQPATKLTGAKMVETSKDVFDYTTVVEE